MNTVENPTAAFAQQFSRMTEHSPRGYEGAVHKLLAGLERYRERGALSAGEYDTIIGHAADTLQQFHLTLDTLKTSEQWYRNSVIHQMGQGMLQAVRAMREDLTTDSLYKQALTGLSIGQSSAAHLHDNTQCTRRTFASSVMPRKHLHETGERMRWRR